MFNVMPGESSEYIYIFARDKNAWDSVNVSVSAIFETWYKVWERNVGGFATFEVLNDGSQCSARGTVLTKPFFLTVSPARRDKTMYARVDVYCTKNIDGKNVLAGTFLVKETGDIYDVDAVKKIDTLGTPNPYWLLLCNVLQSVLDADI